MLVNREAQPAHQPPSGALTGLGIFDVSQPSRPREIAFWRCGGAGVHRFTFDGRFAYISPEMDGYTGNIVMILDLMDPTRPREIGRWWMPGQWTAGGETPSWSGRQHRCHHPIRLDNRLYVSYWHGGFVILDIEDMARPRLLSGLDWSPPFITPTHTALPCPFLSRPTAPRGGRRGRGQARARPAVLPVAGGHHGRAAAGSLRELPGRGRRRSAPAGVHGLPPAVRARDGNGHSGGVVRPRPAHRGYRPAARAPREVAHFLPEPPPGHSRVSSNDVEVDDRGLST